MATPDDVTVPPEIVEKAAKAVHDEMGDKCSHDALGDDCRYISRGVLAAVYGDIVEAARREFAGEIERLRVVVAVMTVSQDQVLDQSRREEAEIAQLRQQLTLSRLGQFAPMGDNHHNAAVCPYCSPDRDRAVRDARREVLDQVARLIGEGPIDEVTYEGLTAAARIVAGLRDSEATE